MRLKNLGLAALGLGLWVVLSGCGPGLIILGGGGAGGWLAFPGGNDDKDKKTPAPISGGPTNTAPVAIVQGLVREESPATISFRLIDAEADLIDVIIEYATVEDPTDLDFQPCTAATGSETAGLISSAGGVNHTFAWNYVEDLSGQSARTGITIRVRPNDGTVDGSIGELGDLVVGNSVPVVVTAQAVGATLSGNVLITFTLSDSTSDMSALEVRIISSQSPTPVELTGADFLGTNPIGLPGVLSTSPDGTAGQVVWNSEQTFPFHDGTVQIVLTPKDQPAGFSQVGLGNGLIIGPYVLNNLGNRAPTMQLQGTLDGRSFYGSVDFTVLVQDLDANSVYVQCEYQVNPAGAYADCTISSSLGTSVGAVGPFATLANQPLAYNLRWRALLDLQALGQYSFDRCRLRLTVFDAVVGQVINTGQFEVVLAEAPEVFSVQVQGDDGAIPIVINLLDRAADPCSLQISYRLDASASFKPLSQSDFTFGDLSSAISGSFGSGYPNVFIWNTLSPNLVDDFGVNEPNKPTVYLQIIATDHPPDDDTGDTFPIELQSQAFIFGPFPVLNNPTDLTVVSVTISETSGEDDYTIKPNEVREFSATVFPAQSSPDDEVYWWIWPYWFATIDPDPGPSTTATLTMGSDTQGWDYIEVWCESVQTSGVVAFYRLYVGDPVTDVVTIPDTQVTLLSEDSFQFSATVQPLTAPQYLDWSVPVGMGYIYSNGYYSAPTTLVMLDFLVTVKTINPNVKKTIPVKVLPRPTQIVITGPPTVAVGGSNQNYSATVLPASAPQDVTWHVYWNDMLFLSGNEFCGFISPSGVYTPPAVLPQPNSVAIVAKSVYLTWLYAYHPVNLTAQNPTNFNIAMTPNAPTFVYANGQGKIFSAVSFTPPDAPYVTWTLDQSGLGSIDAVSGYYIPPEDIGATATSVTVRATATYGGLQKTFNLQIQPKQLGAMPTNISFVPGSGCLPDDSWYGHGVLSLVNPVQAEQDVTWSIHSGPPANQGSLTPYGNYAQYNAPYNTTSYPFDSTVVVRATSVVPPNINGSTNINICGLGQWQTHDVPSLGRNDVTGVWDDFTNTCWFIGGRGDNNRAGEQAMIPWVYNGSALANPRWYAGPEIDKAFHLPIPLKNAIAMQRVPQLAGTGNPHLVALVGDGNNQVRMVALNLTTITDWVEIAVEPDSGGGATEDDVPRLSGIGRYHMFYHDGHLLLLFGSHIYRFNPQTGLWAPRFENVIGQPAIPNSYALIDYAAAGKVYLIGPSVSQPLETVVLSLDTSPTPMWSVIHQTAGAATGPAHPSFTDGAGVVTPGGNFLVFGGRRNGNASDEMWEFSPGTLSWIFRTGIGARPSPRSDAAFVAVKENGVDRLLLFGGRLGLLGLGIAGDLWEFNNATTIFTAFNPSGIFPQARKHAAVAWRPSTTPSQNAGYMFGGVCQYGNSNETWRFTYAPSTGFTWTRFAFTNLAAPPALRGASMVWDETNARMLLLWGSFFSSGAAGSDNAVYAFNVSTNTWTYIFPSGGAPPERMFAAVCYDPVNQRVVSFGGLTQNSGQPALLGSVVFLSTPAGGGSIAWQPAPAPAGPNYPPPPTFGAFAGFDAMGYNSAGANRYLIYGGNRSATGESLSSEIYAYNTNSNTWSSVLMKRPWSAVTGYDSACAFDASPWRRFLIAPKGDRVAVGAIMGVNPEWYTMRYADFDFNPRSAMGVFDPQNRRFFALMGEVDIPGVGATNVGAFRVLRLGG